MIKCSVMCLNLISLYNLKLYKETWYRIMNKIVWAYLLFSDHEFKLKFKIVKRMKYELIKIMLDEIVLK